MTAQTPMFSDDYQRQLREKHAGDWGDTALRYYPSLLTMVADFGAKSVLDYGCGKGVIGAKLREEQAQGRHAGLVIHEYDPGIEGKTDASTQGDVLFNADVLEHIEPEFLDNVLADMAGRTKKGAFMVINCAPALQILPDGRNAHLIIQPAAWWLKKLDAYFDVVQSMDTKDELYVVAVPKGAPVPKVSFSFRKESVADQSLDHIRGLIDEKHYTQARLALLSENARNAGIQFLLGRIAYETGDYQSAAGAFFESQKITPHPETFKRLGLALAQLGQYETALQYLDRPECRAAFAHEWEYSTHLMLGWNKMLQPQKAIDYYRALDNDEAHIFDAYILALVLNQDWALARQEAEGGVERHPGSASRWAVLGHVYDSTRAFADATRATRRAVELDPKNAAYQSNLGLALMHENDLEGAGAAFARAIEIDPNLTAAYVNRANIHRLQGDYKAEEAELRRCLEIDPILADAHYGLGISLIRQERYLEGSAQAEWFWHKTTLTSTRLPLTFRRWYGEDLTGKTLLVYADQGVGDTIMMARYIGLILRERKPAHIILNVNTKLRGLFEHQYADAINSGQITIFEDTMRMGTQNIDFSVACSSLPHVMKTRITTIPASAGYMKTRDTISYKKDDPNAFVIGLSWYTKSMDAGIYRSLKLMDFAFLGQMPGVRVVDLQYGDTAAERAQAAQAGFNIIHDDSVDAWSDLQASADQIAACDLVISIDNTTVHSAGALGVPAWVILPEHCYWRWPIRGDATPWYDSLRLFRQEKGKPYTDILPHIKDALEKLRAGDASQRIPEKFTPLFEAREDQPRALLINDTGGCYSWGNFASLEGIKTGLQGRGFDLRLLHTLALSAYAEHLPALKDFDDPVFLSQCRYRNPTLFHHMETASCVVINGEGMLNNLSDSTLQILYLAYVAKTVFGKRTALINASCFPEGAINLTDANRLAFYLKGLKSFDAVAAREQLSLDLLRSLGVQAHLGFDPAVLWLRHWADGRKLPARGKLAVISGGPGYETRLAPVYADLCKKLRQQGLTPVMLYGAQWQTAQEDLMLAADLDDLAPGQVELRRCTDMETFMETLASAALVVTGFYPLCALAFALNTSVLPLSGGSNAVALAGLARTCGSPMPVFYNNENLSESLGISLKDVLKQKLDPKQRFHSILPNLCDSALKNIDSF